MRLLFVALVLLCSYPNVAQVVDESGMLVFVERTHFDLRTGGTKSCLRVAENGDFRLEQLPNSSSKHGIVFEGIVRPEQLERFRAIVAADDTKSLGNMSPSNKPVMFSDPANVVEVVIPRPPHQTIVLMNIASTPPFPEPVKLLLRELESVEKMKKAKIKGAEPQSCRPLRELSPVYH